ncbi:hypothetical protein AB6A23_22495 [Paenibacillus tarimensis]
MTLFIIKKLSRRFAALIHGNRFQYEVASIHRDEMSPGQIAAQGFYLSLPWV